MPNRRMEAFLVRLVVDEQTTASSAWHGRIQHIGSGSERHFEQVSEALAFISEQVHSQASAAAVSPAALPEAR